jgi:hypothetical protein
MPRRFDLSGHKAPPTVDPPPPPRGSIGLNSWLGFDGPSGMLRHRMQTLRATLSALNPRYRDRHTASGLGFTFADRIAYVNGEHWDRVARTNSFFLRRDVLGVIEDHGPDNIVPRYAIVFRDDVPVAIVVAQILTITGERLHRTPEARAEDSRVGLLRRVLAPASRAVGDRLRERMLVAGNLLSWGFHGVGFGKGESPAALWPAVAEAIYRIRRAEKLSGNLDFAMVKDLTPAQAGVESLHRYSYRPLETEPNMVLAIDPTWRTYEDYLNALDAKYRRKVKDITKKLETASCTIERPRDLAAHQARLHELYLAVQKNAAVRLITIRDAYLPTLAARVGDDFRCTVIKRAGEIIGFVSSVRDGDTAIGYYIGFDRAAATEGLPIYLRLLHATVEDAIAWKVRSLSLGRTALEPKAGLGAKPEPMSVWVRHRVAPVNWLFRELLGAVPHNEPPERSPFKTRTG